MNDKERILTMLTAEFQWWDELLTSRSAEQITVPRPPAHLSIKDVVAHLRAWQQVSIARLEAAQRQGEPVLPDWLAGSDPEAEAETDQFNARIYELYRDQPWPQVYHQWRDGFLHFVELAESIPETDLLDTDKYPWLKGYSLLAVLHGSHEHHREHREGLLA